MGSASSGTMKRFCVNYSVTHIYIISTAPKKFSDHYILSSELGSGAFSVVKLAVNKVRRYNLFFITPHVLIHVPIRKLAPRQR